MSPMCSNSTAVPVHVRTARALPHFLNVTWYKGKLCEISNVTKIPAVQTPPSNHIIRCLQVWKKRSRSTVVRHSSPKKSVVCGLLSPTVSFKDCKVI